MGECGCSDVQDGMIIETKSGEKILIGLWDRTCPCCESHPMISAGIITDEDAENYQECGFKLYKMPEMFGNAFIILDYTEKLESALKKSFEHLLDEHIHDREECSEIFNSKGKPRTKWNKLDKELNGGGF
jgi:hypothetical protein